MKKNVKLTPLTVQRFNALRAQGDTADGLVSLFQTATGWDAYRTLSTAISANAGVVTRVMRDTAATQPARPHKTRRWRDGSPDMLPSNDTTWRHSA